MKLGNQIVSNHHYMSMIHKSYLPLRPLHWTWDPCILLLTEIFPSFTCPKRSLIFHFLFESSYCKVPLFSKCHSIFPVFLAKTLQSSLTTLFHPNPTYFPETKPVYSTFRSTQNLHTSFHPHCHQCDSNRHPLSPGLLE